jgi:DNA sulfur modification protein DndD
MILERLVFENFRQFRGRQELVFSDVRERNVTIVHAENGFGKTTILKGLLWVLYGRDGLMGTDGQADDFEMPDRLINEGVAALAAGDPHRAEASVELVFKHEGDRYVLKRSLTLAKQRLNPKDTDLTLVIMRDGETFRQDNPQQRIQAIIPEGIRKLLFFNGERINYLAMQRSSAEVSEAIRQMLGLQLLERTINDLNHPNVKGKLRADLRQQPTSEEKRELLDQREQAEGRLAEQQESIKQIRKNLAAVDQQVEVINAKLSANQKAHELQARRNRLTKELEELVARKEESSKKLARLIAEDGYMLFTSDLVKRGQDIIARLRAEGKIPARVLNTFLDDLLNSEVCICKRDLAPGTPHRHAVEELKTIAGDADFNNAVGALDHAIGVLMEGARKTEEQIRDLNIERLELARQISEREEQIEEIHQLISGKNDDEAQDLEARRTKLLLDRDSYNAELGRTEGRIEDCQAEIARLGDQMRQIEEKDASADLAQRRVTAVEDCAAILKRILDAETEDLRPLLNEEISKHFRKIMDRDFWPELADDFTLRIRKRVAGAIVDGEDSEIDAALSTGQRTVTSLVFIASLVALANRRSEIPTIVRGLSGSAYPIAIDSPFGSLSMFRKDVARYVPELAPQVLLLVSPTQYDGDVDEALESVGRVGKRYYLTFTGPTIPDRANPELVVGGQKIQQYFPSTDEEFTQICEL